MVRLFTNREDGKLVVPAKVWDHVDTLIDGQPMFPFLRYLIFRTEDASNKDVIRFTWKRLDRLDITLDATDPFAEIDECSAISREIVSRAPDLHSLTMFLSHDVDVPAAYFAPMVDFHHLRYVCIEQGWVRMEAMSVFSKFPALEELVADIKSPEDDSEQLVFTGFVCLEKLYCIDISHAEQSGLKRRILEACASSPLLSLKMGDDLEYSSVLTLEEWQPLCELIARQFPALEEFTWRISRISIDGLEPDEIVDNTNSSLLDAIESLLALRTLIIVDIDFGALDVHLTDDFYSAIASAWPKLASLTFLCTPPDQARPELATGVTPRTLAEFARRCPSLVKLAIPFIHIAPDPNPESPGSNRNGTEGMQHPYNFSRRMLTVPKNDPPCTLPDAAAFPLMDHPLKELRFDCALDAGAADAVGLGFILDRMFPSLTRMGSADRMWWGEHYRSPAEGQVDFWDGVLATVKICRRARRNRDIVTLAEMMSEDAGGQDQENT